MNNMVFVDFELLGAWTLLISLSNDQEHYKKPYMNGSNNMYLWRTYNNGQEAHEVKKT